MTDLINPSADYSGGGNRAFRLPVARGARYYNLFRGGAPSLTRNLVSGQPTPTVGGAPTYGTGYTRFTANSNFLDSLLSETAVMTYYVAGRGVASAFTTTRPIYVGNNAGSSLGNAGTTLYPYDDNEIAGSCAANDAGALSFVTGRVPADPNAWGFVAMVVDGANGFVRHFTNGVPAAPLVVSSPRDLTNARTLRIGSGYSSGFAGVCDIINLGIHLDVALTVNELTLAYERAKTAAAMDGISL